MVFREFQKCFELNQVSTVGVLDVDRGQRCVEVRHKVNDWCGVDQLYQFGQKRILDRSAVTLPIQERHQEFLDQDNDGRLWAILFWKALHTELNQKLDESTHIELISFRCGYRRRQVSFLCLC